MLRSKLSEHDFSSTYSSPRSENSTCSEVFGGDECESMMSGGKTDKAHEILDKVSSKIHYYITALSKKLIRILYFYSMFIY